MQKKPSVLSEGIIFYVSSAYPPTPGGSAVINRNLLSYFDDDSYVLVKAKRNVPNGLEGVLPKKAFDLMRLYDQAPVPVFNFLAKLQLPIATYRLKGLAKQYQPKALVAAYPNYFFLRAATDVSIETGLPLVAYLHDTVAEALSGSSLKEDAKKLQQQLFEKAKLIFVMSEGMATLYKRKYGIDSIPLLHPYNEPISDTIAPYGYRKTAFWGGSIYGINNQSVIRLNNAFAGMGFEYRIADDTTYGLLKRSGISGNHVRLTFYREREQYINAVNGSGILTLALDWPDESSTHEDELSTIFPTKTVEYLASGGLILVHCPEHYFMSIFFKRNQCGIVVNHKSVDALIDAVSGVLKCPERVDFYRKRALETAKLFAIEKIAGSFSNTINTMLRLND